MSMPASDPSLIEAIANALFEAADRLPGTRIPVITATDLAQVALTAIGAAGFTINRTEKD